MQIQKDTTDKNQAAFLCRSYKDPKFNLYCGYCLSYCLSMSKHKFYCYHDNRRRYRWYFYIYDTTGERKKDEAGRDLIRSEGPYKPLTWQFGQVRECFPPLNATLRGALHEIHFKKYYDDKIGDLVAPPPAPKDGKKLDFDPAKNCRNLVGLMEFDGDKDQDTFRVWCLYFKNHEKIVPKHSIPYGMPADTPVYDVRRGKKTSK